MRFFAYQIVARELTKNYRIWKLTKCLFYVLGVDLGSLKCVMAVTKRGGIEIVLNEASNRQTPAEVAFTQTERLAGEAVKFQINKNFKNTVLFATRFLGLNTACKEQLELEKRFITHEIVELDNCKMAFKVKQMEETYTLTVEQIIAFELTKLKKHYEKADIMTKDIMYGVR